MKNNNIFKYFAAHLSMLGLPATDGLADILRENFSKEEAEIAMMLPPDNIPLTPVTPDELANETGRDRERIAEILSGLAARNMIYTGKNRDGLTGYALHHPGFGFPQTFFWKGEKNRYALEMSRLVIKYFNRKVTREAFGGTSTKAYRYVPVQRSLNPEVQTVLPHDIMTNLLDRAHRFAVAHCTCRVQADLMGRPCDHPLEVCIKFDEMADYIIDQNLGREITREQAGRIVDQAAEAGLVHFVDNAEGKIKHNCNCCGCACWNVGTIRRRKIPRDELMAVYFIRRTDTDLCAGCGLCIDICPVNAVTMEDGTASVDEDWCIGCGVCTSRCEFDAIEIVYRENMKKIPEDFDTLHKKIIKETDPGHQ